VQIFFLKFSLQFTVISCDTQKLVVVMKYSLEKNDKCYFYQLSTSQESVHE